jgi:myosin heavy subunit
VEVGRGASCVRAPWTCTLCVASCRRAVRCAPAADRDAHAPPSVRQGTWVWVTDPKTKNTAGGQIVEVVAAGKEYSVRAYDGSVRERARGHSVRTYDARVGLTCRAAGGANTQLTTVKVADLKSMHHATMDGIDDMIMLTELHESSLLHNLRVRYFQDKIYVRAGLSWRADEPV